MFKESKFLIVAFGFLFCIGCGSPSDSGSDDSSLPYPKFTGKDFHGEKNFANLINNYSIGQPEPQPWAGYWWPYSSNGIADGHYGNPAGKYDAVRGGSSQAQAWEAQNHGSGVKNLQQWWGHCNGWCAAAALFPEPKAPARVNGVEFGIADIKALLTEAGMEVSADFYGERVDYASDYDTPKYYDTVPDQYFLVLTNYMGKLKQAVLIDRYTGDQIWNQPLAGYRFEYPSASDYLGADPSAPSVYRVMLTSTLWWLRDDVSPDVTTPEFKFEDNDFVESRTLKMEVWLDGPVQFDSNGKIISSGDVITTRQGQFVLGGAWRMGDGFFTDAWPDYMWIPYSIQKPTDYANAFVDIEWIKKHLLVPGGSDDAGSSPRPSHTFTSQPGPEPTHTAEPFPSFTPTHLPPPEPAPWPSSFPFPWPTEAPTSTPSTSPHPWPTPRPSSFPLESNLDEL